MSIKDSTEGSRKRPTWVTAVVLLNVALLAALLLPWSRNWDLWSWIRLKRVIGPKWTQIQESDGEDAPLIH
jgi:hypothetical protein